MGHAQDLFIVILGNGKPVKSFTSGKNMIRFLLKKNNWLQ